MLVSDPPNANTWRATEGFACVLVLLLSSLGINEGLRIAYHSFPGFAAWASGSPYFAEGSFMGLRACIWVVLAYLFSREGSIQGFIRSAGFARRPTVSGWFVTWGAIGAGVMELYLLRKGSSNASESAHNFYSGGEAAWTFFVIFTIVVAPFCEEALIRGFLYSAFRVSFGIVASMCFVTCVQVYFHWGVVSHDLVAFSFLVGGGIMLCLLRERTGNTWNCVLFHGAFNAIVTRQWSVCFVGMLLGLLACESRTVQQGATAERR